MYSLDRLVQICISMSGAKPKRTVFGSLSARAAIFLSGTSRNELVGELSVSGTIFGVV